MSRDEKSNYYDAGDVPVIDVIEAKLTPEQYTGYLLGNIIKYSCRLNFKGSSVRDSEKLKYYSTWLESDFKKENGCGDSDRDAYGRPICPDCGECDRDYMSKIGEKHHG